MNNTALKLCQALQEFGQGYAAGPEWVHSSTTHLSEAFLEG